MEVDQSFYSPGSVRRAGYAFCPDGDATGRIQGRNCSTRQLSGNEAADGLTALTCAKRRRPIAGLTQGREVSMSESIELNEDTRALVDLAITVARRAWECAEQTARVPWEQGVNMGPIEPDRTSQGLVLRLDGILPVGIVTPWGAFPLMQSPTHDVSRAWFYENMAFGNSLPRRPGDPAQMLNVPILRVGNHELEQAALRPPDLKPHASEIARERWWVILNDWKRRHPDLI